MTFSVFRERIAPGVDHVRIGPPGPSRAPEYGVLVLPPDKADELVAALGAPPVWNETTLRAAMRRSLADIEAMAETLGAAQRASTADREAARGWRRSALRLVSLLRGALGTRRLELETPAEQEARHNRDGARMLADAIAEADEPAEGDTVHVEDMRAGEDTDEFMTRLVVAASAPAPNEHPNARLLAFALSQADDDDEHAVGAVVAAPSKPEYLTCGCGWTYLRGAKCDNPVHRPKIQTEGDWLAAWDAAVAPAADKLWSSAFRGHNAQPDEAWIASALKFSDAGRADRARSIVVLVGRDLPLVVRVAQGDFRDDVTARLRETLGMVGTARLVEWRCLDRRGCGAKWRAIEGAAQSDCFRCGRAVPERAQPGRTAIHDDGCGAELVNGYCPRCRVVPDMQSVAFRVEEARTR